MAAPAAGEEMDADTVMQQHTIEEEDKELLSRTGFLYHQLTPDTPTASIVASVVQENPVSSQPEVLQRLGKTIKLVFKNHAIREEVCKIGLQFLGKRYIYCQTALQGRIGAQAGSTDITCLRATIEHARFHRGRKAYGNGFNPSRISSMADI